MNFSVMKAFIIKEFKQIIRDSSSILIAFILPLILLFLFGFGINFDTNTVKIGIVDLDMSPKSRDFAQSLVNTRYLDCIFIKTTNEADKLLAGGKIRGYAVIPVNFTAEFMKMKKDKSGANPAPQGKKSGSFPLSALNRPSIQIVTDGTEPNTAKFAASYIEGAYNAWAGYVSSQTAKTETGGGIQTIQRAWYNPALKSTYFVLPGSLAIIMTMTGTVLTALVIAREWERGTMEALLTTEITKVEFVLSKYIAYFVLGMLSIAFCLFIIIFIFRVPFRGSYFALLISSSLFMMTGLGSGLLVSTLFRDQFTSSQVAGTIGFMPSMMLSGLIYEIDSMPFLIKILSYIIPSKYFVSSITSLFLSGVIIKTLIINGIYMLLFSLFMGILIIKSTKERIEEC